ncbi:hypothetical protein Anapl_07994 [Anas platyrhynchos]|uniref:Uncharacterized protein n=1 Tax=Anas platyrhynchos TaxID=8839 RepID=R0M2T2_ANAPL|nr:hypothetical protein Anapl_07994 [Anas platyrhynchos]
MGTLLPLFHLPTVKEHMILGYQAIAVGNKTSLNINCIQTGTSEFTSSLPQLEEGNAWFTSPTPAHTSEYGLELLANRKKAKLMPAEITTLQKVMPEILLCNAEIQNPHHLFLEKHGWDLRKSCREKKRVQQQHVSVMSVKAANCPTASSNARDIPSGHTVFLT